MSGQQHPHWFTLLGLGEPARLTGRRRFNGSYQFEFPDEHLARVRWAVGSATVEGRAKFTK